MTYTELTPGDQRTILKGMKKDAERQHYEATMNATLTHASEHQVRAEQLAECIQQLGQALDALPDS